MKTLQAAALIAAMSIGLAAPAKADQHASLVTADIAIAAVDAYQTCQFARPGETQYNLHESASAWIIGQHPTCAKSFAYIVGSRAAVALLLPRTKLGNTLLKIDVGFGAANVLNNVRLMAEWKF